MMMNEGSTRKGYRASMAFLRHICGPTEMIPGHTRFLCFLFRSRGYFVRFILAGFCSSLRKKVGGNLRQKSLRNAYVEEGEAGKIGGSA